MKIEGTTIVDSGFKIVYIEDGIFKGLLPKAIDPCKNCNNNIPGQMRVCACSLSGPPVTC